MEKFVILPVQKYEQLSSDVPSCDLSISLRQDGDFDLLIENPENFGVSGSSLSTKERGFSYKIKYNDFHKTRHECVLFPLTGKFFESDQEIYTSFGFREFDGGDNKTPDFIYKDEENKRFYVVEMKTRYGGDLESVYSEAISLYSYYLERRSKRLINYQIYYFVIIVSQKNIVTNLDLTTELGQQIRYACRAHFILGEQIWELGKQNGYNDVTSEEKRVSEVSLNSAINSAASDTDLPNEINYEKPFITKSMLNVWDSFYVSQEEETSYMSKLYSMASKDVEKELSMSEETLALKKLIEFRKGFESTKEYPRKQDMKSPIRLPLMIPLVKPRVNSYEMNPNMFPQSISIEGVDVIVGGANEPAMDHEDIDNASATARLYKEAARAYTHNPQFQESSAKDLLESAFRASDLMNDERLKRKRNRFKVRLTEEDKRELAEQGVGSKKFKDDVLLSDKYKLSKQSYLWETNTNDISVFVNETIFSLLKESDVPFLNSWERIKPLYIASMRTYFKDGLPIRDEAMEDILMFLKTKLGSALSMMASALEELNLSVSQPTSPNEFIFKRVMGTNIHMIIHTTGASNHIFYSFAFKKGESHSIGRPFERTYDIGDWVCTEFSSFNRHRLSHLIYMQCRSASILALWCELYKVRMRDVLTEPLKHQDLIKTFATSFLIYMEDKAKTSENLQNIRYMYMEVIKTGPTPRDVYKMLTKMDNKVRSRLLLWIYHRLIESFEKMIENPPKSISLGVLSSKDNDEDDDELEEKINPAKSTSGDNFSGLLNWITGEEIKHFEIALNLSYLGVLHNKDESEENQANHQILRKIVDLEIKMRDADVTYMGYKTKEKLEDYKTHEFDYKFALICGNTVKTYLEKKYNGLKGWHSHLLAKISRWNFKKTSDMLATFKSSFKIPNNPNYDPDDRESHRQRVLEGIYELLLEHKLTERPIECINILLKIVMEQGGIRANLFKKAQIGGVREIFVLDIVSRLVVFFSESVIRMINEELPCEMLTKGTQKLTRQISHEKEVEDLLYELRGSERVTNKDSLDCKQWAQQFVMPYFACISMPVLPKQLFKILCLILNENTKKLLEIPHSLMKDWYNHPEINSSDPNMNEFRDQWFGNSEHGDLVSKYQRWLHNESNMMQGINHNFSSFGHAAMKMTLEKFNSRMFNQLLKMKILPSGSRLVQTSLESSDDSSDIRTIVLNLSEVEESLKLKMKRRATLLLCKFSALNKVTYPILCMLLSDYKSTHKNFNMVIEFNSSWTVGNTMMAPLIKFVFAAVDNKTITRLDQRQNVMSDLRRQMLENGSSLMLSRTVEVLQMMLHYASLGCNVNRLFDSYSTMVSLKPHPAFGFFVLDHPRLSGLLGYDFTHYCSVKLNYEVRKVEASLYSKEGMQFSETGKPTVSLSLLLGDAKNYKTFLKRLETKSLIGGLTHKFGLSFQDWRDYGETNPSVLYDYPTTVKDILFNIIKKAKSPSTHESFSFQTTSKLQAASVYILGRAAVTVAQHTSEQIDKMKFSLLEYIKSFDSNTEMKDEWIELIFPSYELYDLIIAEFDMLSKLAAIIPKRIRPKTPVSLTIPRMQTQCTVSLKDCVMQKWFHKNPPSATKVMVDASWVRYSNMIPWLTDDYSTTLASCPFQDAVALSDYIKSLTPSIKTLKVLGPVRQIASFVDNILNIARRCFSSGEILAKTSSARTHIDRTKEISKLVTNLSLVLTTPINSPSERLSYVSEVMINHDKILSDDSTKAAIQMASLSKTDINTGVFQAYFNVVKEVNRIKESRKYTAEKKRSKLDKKITVIGDLLNLAKRGAYGYFSTPQIKDKDGRWFGQGRFSFVVDGMPFELYLADNDIIRVIATSEKSLRSSINGFKQIVKENGFNYRLKSGNDWLMTKRINSWLDYDMYRVTNKQEYDKMVPVSIENNLKPVEFIFDKSSILVTEEGSMKLRYLVKRNAMGSMDSDYVTILHFDPSSWRFSTELVSPVNNGKKTIIQVAWESWKSMNVNDVNRLHLSMTDRIMSPKTSSEDRIKALKTKEWLKRTLCYRVSGLLGPNTLFSNKVDSNEVDTLFSEAEIDVSEFMNFDENDDDNGEAFDKLISGVLEEQQEEMEDEKLNWADDQSVSSSSSSKADDDFVKLTVETQMESTLNDEQLEEMIRSQNELDVTTLDPSRRREKIEKVHPFWRACIELVLQEHSDSDFLKELVLGNYKVEAIRGEMSNIFAWIVDNDGKPLRKTTKRTLTTEQMEETSKDDDTPLF